MGRHSLVLCVWVALGAPGAAFAASDDPLDPPVQAATAAAMRRDATPEEVLEVAGKPDAEYLFRTLVGEIDLWLEKQDNGAVANILTRAEDQKRKVAELRVIEFHGRRCGDCSAILAFKDKKMIYALLPPAGSEETLDDLFNRYGEKPRTLELSGPAGTVRLHAYPDKGIGYLQTGPGKFKMKVVFPPNTKGTAFRGANPVPASGTRPPALVAPAGTAPRPTPPPKRPASSGNRR